MRVMFLLMAVVLVACGSQQDTVHEARFQRRHSRSGWHIDLRRHSESRTVKELKHPIHLNARKSKPREYTLNSPALTAAPPISGADALTFNESTNTAALQHQPFEPPKPSTMRRAPVDVIISQQEGDDNIMPKKRLNGIAIPAFASGLGAIVLGFGTNLWLLLGAIALTLILAGWSIARIRRREQSGKGFAIAALMIGVLTALLTLMSIGRYGTDL